MIIRITLYVMALNTITEAFNILIYWPMPSFSHQRPIIALTRRLLEEGHNVSLISPNVIPELKQNVNYTHVDVSFSYQYFSDQKKEDVVYLQEQLSKWEHARIFQPFANMLAEQVLSEPFSKFKRHVETHQIKYDVVILPSSFIHFLCATVQLLAKETPIITMSTYAIDPVTEEILGSVNHLSFTPSTFSAYTDRMSLLEKLENWYSHIAIIAYLTSVMKTTARKFFRDNFRPSAENLVDGCDNNVSLSLITSNPVYFYPRLLGPNIRQIGPLHLQDPGRLPQNLQDWFDGAEKGVIYFSLGSNMKSKSLPDNVRENFMRFFKELPPGFRVLWKWEVEGRIPGQSDNILAQGWTPQPSVLAHPKVRVFITQGGLQSFQEAVHYGVPTVGIPWFGDQECQVSKMVDANVGVQLLPQDLHSYDKIKAALEKVLFDESYSRNMKKLSAISRDFSSHSMDEAVFWIGHVARHGGASHLRPSTADASFFQYFCLDILSVILIISSLFLISVYLVFKYLFGIISSKIQHQKLKND